MTLHVPPTRLGAPHPEEYAVVVEHAELTVEAGREQEFQEVFGKAREVLAGADGFRWAELLSCVERPRVFLLLVGWDSVEAHTAGFRESERFARWRALVGPFFAAPPAVEHYRELGDRFTG
ncbi:antibiotic biosynthesis monooxygenase family protein [Streptomyces arenae]|uniref:antibiotic biosynthesis monooxygenase family protein n=1 Tax=Streptomyces arenae TaxID=29301 RepID=UPI00265A4992|nr:antibiotic biosynthesis monooxygenase [Streptomyces arenae]MCG7205057.1 antibiotic biosynthesis monooxygenase [Streptomyces arenae]